MHIYTCKGSQGSIIYKALRLPLKGAFNQHFILIFNIFNIYKKLQVYLPLSK